MKKYMRSSLFVLGGLLVACLIGVSGLLALDNTNMRNQIAMSTIGCTSTSVGDIAAVMVVNGTLMCTHSKYEISKQAWNAYMRQVAARGSPIAGDGVTFGKAARDPGGGVIAQQIVYMKCNLVELHRMISGKEGGDIVGCRSS